MKFLPFVRGGEFSVGEYIKSIVAETSDGLGPKIDGIYPVVMSGEASIRGKCMENALHMNLVVGAERSNNIRVEVRYCKAEWVSVEGCQRRRC